MAMVPVLSGCLSLLSTHQDIQSITNGTTRDSSVIHSDDSARIFQKAITYLTARPGTVTADIASRSAGGPNDVYSKVIIGSLFRGGRKPPMRDVTAKAILTILSPIASL